MSLVEVTWWQPDAADARRMEEFLWWLSPGERARHQRFFDAAHRQTFLASRILLRHALAAVTGLAPAALVFTTDTHGVKPHLVAAGDWHFSLTHTDGMVACAVSQAGALGIDAEPLARVTRVEALARRVLSASEHRAWKGLDAGARRSRFFEYWCLKEAWLKAEGTGLRVPPASVGVTFTSGGVQVGAGTRVARLLPVLPTHVVALVHPPLGADAGDPVVVRRLPWATVEP